MATSDDMAALEDTMAGSWASHAQWSDFNRGIKTMTHGPDEGAKDVGFEPVSSSESWENETLFFGFFHFCGVSNSNLKVFLGINIQ